MRWRMAQRKVAVAFTGLYVFVWSVWANLELNMMDRMESFFSDEVEIPCFYIHSKLGNSTKIQWFVESNSNNRRAQIYYNDTNEEVLDEANRFTGRINVSNSHNSTLGRSILTISDVQVTDNLDFICMVTVDGESVEGTTKLSVFNAPSHPVIEPADYASSTSQKLQQVASCEVKDGYPAPNITWYKNLSPLNKFNDDLKVEYSKIVNPNGLITVKSDLYLMVVKEDKDAVFHCEVTFKLPGADKMTESDSFHIMVHYPSTAATMTQVAPKSFVKEGDRVEIKCEGDGNPQEGKEFYYEEEQRFSDNDFLILDNVTRKNSGLYTCTFLDTQTFEEYTANMSLIVHYLDPVVITPKQLDMLDLGQDLSLTCNALSSLPTRTLWTKNGVEVKEGHTLTLNNISYDAAGTYVCKVYALDLPELQREHVVHISVRGKPVIENVEKNASEDNKEIYQVNCIAKGFPIPSIQWKLNNTQALLNEWMPNQSDILVTSSITVRANLDLLVTCHATNEFGIAEKPMEIKGVKTAQPTSTSTTATSTKTPVTVTPQKKVKTEGNGVIIAVIIIFVLLLAILGSVLYFLYKKGRITCGRSGKQDLTKEKTSSDDLIVEMKSGKSEEAVLLQGVNGDKKDSQ